MPDMKPLEKLILKEGKLIDGRGNEVEIEFVGAAVVLSLDDRGREQETNEDYEGAILKKIPEGADAYYEFGRDCCIPMIKTPGFTYPGVQYVRKVSRQE